MECKNACRAKAQHAEQCARMQRIAKRFNALSRGKALVLRTRLRGSSQEQQSNAKKSRLLPLRLD